MSEQVQAAGWTRFPHELIDRWCPVLSHTAWKLLTVLLRETHGWQRGSVSLSRARLMKKTNIQDHRAFTRARDELLACQAVRVTGAAGKRATYHVNLLGMPHVPMVEAEHVPMVEAEQVPMVVSPGNLWWKPMPSKKKERSKEHHQRKAADATDAISEANPDGCDDDEDTSSFSIQDGQSLTDWLATMPPSHIEDRLRGAWLVAQRQREGRSVLRSCQTSCVRESLLELCVPEAKVQSLLKQREPHELLYLLRQAECLAERNVAGFFIRLVENEQEIPADIYQPDEPVCLRVAAEIAEGRIEADSWIQADRWPMLADYWRAFGCDVIEPKLKMKIAPWMEQPEDAPMPRPTQRVVFAQRTVERLPTEEESRNG